MAEVVLYHHIRGLTDGVRAFADDLRQAGHIVHTPDLFDGRTFASIEDGFGFARTKGFDVIRERGAAAADDLGPELVYAGFSFGVTIAQWLAQTRPGARGAVFIDSCLPVTQFGEAWPVGVPVQIHGKEGDEYFDEDLPAARELAGATATAELFTYPGDQHLFADSSLDAYDPEASRLLMERVRAFLASV
ncbi:dienelactone hydrolase family protein [Streptomyces collinus]|uniref:dienelactone hydrolase family protein n=1 Tax=Streptomyces collinus TaxID=42684 RepID=UPI00364131AA